MFDFEKRLTDTPIPLTDMPCCKMLHLYRKLEISTQHYVSTADVTDEWAHRQMDGQTDSEFAARTYQKLLNINFNGMQLIHDRLLVLLILLVIVTVHHIGYIGRSKPICCNNYISPST